jgi:hypothetical protein
MTTSVWKIITVSNFNHESYRQSVVAEHITSHMLGEIMLKALQAIVLEGESTYYDLVPQTKPLWLGMEEFVDSTCSACGEDLYDKRCCL